MGLTKPAVMPIIGATPAMGACLASVRSASKGAISMTRMIRRFSFVPFWLLATFLSYAPGAAAAEPPKLDAANTAWMLTAAVLVLFMTLPGLALFYAGLVRTKNVLSVLVQCVAITCIV